MAAVHPDQRRFLQGPFVDIRHADPDRDAARIAAIYRPHVTDTPISLEEEPPDAAEMAQLLALLARQGVRRLCAGIGLPNEASVALHESRGFQPVGVYPRIGWKFGAWQDVWWWELELPGADPRPSSSRRPG